MFTPVAQNHPFLKAFIIYRMYRERVVCVTRAVNGHSYECGFPEMDLNLSTPLKILFSYIYRNFTENPEKS